MSIRASTPAGAARSPGDGPSAAPERTAGDRLRERDPRVAERAVAARVDGRLVDLSRPVPPEAEVSAVHPESAEGLEVIRHSTAHLLAHAVQEIFPGTQVTIGPVIENGFYYDFVRPEGFTPEDLEAIEARMREIVDRRLPVTRVEIPKSEAIDLFRSMGETYKVEIIEGIPDEIVSLYRQGDWVDLCRGPHVPSTGRLGAFKLTSIAGAYWRGDEKNAQLQRIYGTAWASEKDLRKHLALLEEAKKRDHRRLGKELGLFSFHPEIAPGSPFFHPKGAFLYNRLVSFIRGLYERYEYSEIVTPQICDVDLWKRSGHYDHFREGVFFLEIDGREYGVKPMNCPGHTYVYGAEKRSYRDLPIRYADFSKLHRYEKSGVLHGLTRVRTFAQDDAHVFCTPDQIQEEISRTLAMAREVHHAFELGEIEVHLSTRPAERMGSDEMWDVTEGALAAALRANDLEYDVSPGEGAFYGPKIDFQFRDALGRRWQLTTVQLDQALPERFDLHYTTPEGTEARPVMIHRALLGSIERFLGILIEHTGGAFPTWLSPVQAKVLTVTDRQLEYAGRVARSLRERKIRVEVDSRNEKLGYKIREARLERVPYMVVLGDREVESDTVAPRPRGGEPLPPMPIDAFAERLAAEAAEPAPRGGA